MVICAEQHGQEVALEGRRVLSRRQAAPSGSPPIELISCGRPRVGRQQTQPSYSVWRPPREGHGDYAPEAQARDCKLRRKLAQKDFDRVIKRRRVQGRSADLQAWHLVPDSWDDIAPQSGRTSHPREEYQMQSTTSRVHLSPSQSPN